MWKLTILLTTLLILGYGCAISSRAERQVFEIVYTNYIYINYKYAYICILNFKHIC
jgi:hypothetical protein